MIHKFLAPLSNDKTGFGVLFIFLQITLALTFGCRPSEIKNKSVSYFDMDSCIDAQIKILKAQNRPLDKKSSVSDTCLCKPADAEQSIINAPDYAKELSFFRRASISKPTWKDQYKIIYTKNHPDSSSLSYIPKQDNEQMPILILYRHEPSKLIYKIEAQLVHDNAIFYSLQHCILFFENSVLKKWQIKGYQKMVLRPRSFFITQAQSVSSISE